MKNLQSFGLALTLMTLSSSAQARFCIGGDLDALTAAQVHACQEKSDAVRQEALRQGVPSDWHFVTVCDEGGWQAMANMKLDQTENSTEAKQATDTKLRLTLVRGSRLQLGDLHQVNVLLAEVRESVPQVAWLSVKTTPARPLPTRTTHAQLLTSGLR